MAVKQTESSKKKYVLNLYSQKSSIKINTRKLSPKIKQNVKIFNIQIFKDTD